MFVVTLTLNKTLRNGVSYMDLPSLMLNVKDAEGNFVTISPSCLLYTSYTDGLEIEGFHWEELEPYQALTVRRELEEGYFYFNQVLHMIKLSTMAVSYTHLQNRDEESP